MLADVSSAAPVPSDAGLAAQSGSGKLAFGKYRIHRRIGRGGMGEVYLASLVGELGFEKRLVIKTILPELAAKPRFVEMFAAEAKTAVSLSHGNIVPIYELGKADDTLYIVMGHVDGPSVERMLKAYRKREEPADVGLSLFLMREVLTGLAYAHTEEAGRPAVVHRDISPRNVLVDRSGQVRIVDFGIAVPANVESQVRGGSTGYMAPEQARAELADPRADVFSAACMLYELLTLDQAFPKKGVWVAPDMAGLPEELADVLQRALSIDPLRRPADAGAFVTALGPAFARFSATLTDTALAAHLRELFPQGWEKTADDESDPDRLTPVTNVEPKTYATRLTEITGGVRPIARPGSDVDDGSEGKAADRDRKRTAWPALALLGLGTVTVWLISTLPRSSETAVEASQQRPELSARSEEPRERADVRRPTNGDDGKSEAASAEDGSTPLAEGGPDDADTTPPPQPAPSWLTLTVEPSDAEVTVGGVPLSGQSPYRIPIPDQGEASVRAARSGFVAQTFTVQAGESTGDKAITLQREQPKGKGTLQVVSTTYNWADVTVDGKSYHHTPTKRIELTEGRHRVVVRCMPKVCPTPQVVLDKTVTIKADEFLKLDAK